MGLWKGKTSNCHWYYFSGPNNQWQDFVEGLRITFDTASPGDVLIVMPFRADSPNALERRAAVELIKSHPGAHKLAFHAFVTDSKLNYTMNTAISMLAQKPWKESTFLEPEAAFRWLKSVSPAFDAEAVRRAMAEKVPREYRWEPYLTT